MTRYPLLRARPVHCAAATLIAIGVGAVVFLSSSRTGEAGPAPAAVIAPRVQAPEPPPGPEGMLYRTLAELSRTRLDAAITEIDKVVRDYPHFRLAHLIRGDLLLARAQPLTTVGNAPHAPHDLLEDLREEARARLARMSQPRPVNLVPRALVRMHPEQRQALVVDTSRSTLYVFENRNGEPRYVADYYVSIGKQGYDKYREGDNKTPLGVYHVTASLSRETLASRYGRLAEQYGAGALPISYPNEWDRREGRNGYGIWLHGVPFDTYSRPPRASNGCVALTNEDFVTIARDAQVGLTPVIIEHGVRWIAPGEGRALREAFARRIDSWRRDWESLDTDRFLAHYAETFRAGKQDFEAFAAKKRRVNARKKWVRLQLDRLSVFLYPGRDDLAVVTFDQDYASDNHTHRMRKRQYWQREGDTWRIVHEGAA